MRPVSSQADYDPRHYRFTRHSGLTGKDFEPTRLDRAGAIFFSVVMSAAGVVIVLGITFGWFQ